jgi:hypothetical protein
MGQTVALVLLALILGAYSSVNLPRSSFKTSSRTIRYESEDAHVIGVARVASTPNDYSGTGFVHFPTESKEYEEGTIIFTVNIPSDNKYTFNIAYTTSENSWLSVKINGIEDVVSALPGSDRWSTKVESVFFRQGLNSVILRGVKMTSPLSLDYIEVVGAVPIAANGATLPYYELEAENATTNGNVIGPSRTLYMLPTEASGRLAVQINQGQYVEWTLTDSANAIVVRFSIPDTPNGSGQVAGLNVLVDGTLAFNLTVSSIYSWAYGDYPFSKNPGEGKAHHFYDEVRGLFGKTLNAGQKVRVVAVNPITYTIDLADFYTVPAPYPMPSGYLSVTDNGADPTGMKDSTQAFQTTLNTAATQNKGMNSWFL